MTAGIIDQAHGIVDRYALRDPNKQGNAARDRLMGGIHCIGGGHENERGIRWLRDRPACRGHTLEYRDPMNRLARAARLDAG